jgi:hypothetical protein
MTTLWTDAELDCVRSVILANGQVPYRAECLALSDHMVATLGTPRRSAEAIAQKANRIRHEVLGNQPDTPPATAEPSLEPATVRSAPTGPLAMAQIEAMLAAMPTMEPAQERRLVVPPSLHNNGAEAILELSDMHMGQLVEADRVGGLARYDTDTFKARLERYLTSVASITRAQRLSNGPLTTAHVMMAGDMVDGEGIYATQAADLAVPAIEQITDLGHHLATRLFPALLDMGYDTINCYCVPGNHGRPGGRKSNLHPSTNFDTILYHFMRAFTRQYEQINWRISRGKHLFIRIHNRLHYLHHGDNIPNNLGIPWYGLLRSYNKVSALADEIVWAMHLGHFHTASSIPTARLGVISMNGCWPGGSDLSVNVMMANGVPAQMMHIVDRDRLVVTMSIALDEPLRLPSHQGVLSPCYELPDDLLATVDADD